jgi:WD40 repeat protein
MQAVRVSSPAAPHTAAGPGAQLWVNRYNGSNSNDDALAVAVSPGGGTVFVTGASAGTTSGEDYATVGYDAATGAQLWVMRYNGPGNSVDEASSVAVSPSGGTVFVTGSSTGASGLDYATVAYSAATGAQLWVGRYTSPALQGAATSVAVSPSGSTVFVTGYSAGHTSGYDYATVAYDAATGTQLWVKRYNGPAGDDYAHSVAVSPSGSTVFVTGSSTGTDDGWDYATVAYDAATGAQLWAERYNGPGSADDQAYSVAVSPGGGTVVVTGYSDASSTSAGFDYATVAYDAATGARLWVKRYNGPGKSTDEAFAVALSPSGSTVYVTGYSDGCICGGEDYATVGYDAATGTQLWVKRYHGNGPSGSVAQAVAVSPTTGTVFVTGYSSGSFTANDYATIAYNG